MRSRRDGHRFGARRIALDYLADTPASEVRLDSFASEWRVENELAAIVDDELS